MLPYIAYMDPMGNKVRIKFNQSIMVNNTYDQITNYCKPTHRYRYTVVCGQEGLSLAECFFTLHYEPLDLNDVPRYLREGICRDPLMVGRNIMKYGMKYGETWFLRKQKGTYWNIVDNCCKPNNKRNHPQNHHKWLV